MSTIRNNTFAAIVVGTLLSLPAVALASVVVYLYAAIASFLILSFAGVSDTWLHLFFWNIMPELVRAVVASTVLWWAVSKMFVLHDVLRVKISILAIFSAIYIVLMLIALSMIGMSWDIVRSVIFLVAFVVSFFQSEVGK